jgi:hypothetical protein
MALIVVLAGCGDLPTHAAGRLTGTWDVATATLSESGFAGTSTISELVLGFTHTGTALTGYSSTWTFGIQGSAGQSSIPILGSAILGGEVHGDSLQFDIVPGFHFSATVAGDSIKGLATYTLEHFGNRTLVQTGSFTAVRHR